MQLDSLPCIDYQFHAGQRQQLVQRIAERYPQGGVLLLVGAFERERELFHQDSNFFYLTGITEPGLIATVAIPSGHTIIWEPSYAVPRHTWSTIAQPIDQQSVGLYRCDEYRFAGQTVPGVSVHPFGDAPLYEAVIAYLASCMQKKESIFSAVTTVDTEQAPQRYFLERLLGTVLLQGSQQIDVRDELYRLRRTKHAPEIAHLEAAVAITAQAQQAAATGVMRLESEADIRARIMHTYTRFGCSAAFPSIVAGGKRATVLHHNSGQHLINCGELVLVDIGAQANHYCADITRMYPAGGYFSKRQQQLYELVLEVQELVQKAAIPGMWMSNKDHPDKSLQHIAWDALQKRGFGPEVMPHSIGHWLGLDTHDVGNYTQPLREGDMFTIEPGVYLPEEGIGIRIEDNYWIRDGKAHCISSAIPKSVADITALLKNL